MKFLYRCPVCHHPLEKVDQSFICQQRHTYDIAREGYVNFLLSHHKKSKNPGDNHFMVEQRKLFLDKEYYHPLSDKMQNILMSLTAHRNEKDIVPYHILDSGCGVGSYSQYFKKNFTRLPSNNFVHFWGIDISKPAILKASKNSSSIEFCVGSAFDFPYLNESFDIIFSIFSPFDSEEILRVLKPRGFILLVRPGSSHLQELGSLIYDTFKLQGKSSDLPEHFGAKAHLIQNLELRYEMRLRNNQDIMSLIAMTPYYWHISAEKKMVLEKINTLNVTADFQLLLFEKS